MRDGDVFTEQASLDAGLRSSVASYVTELADAVERMERAARFNEERGCEGGRGSRIYRIAAREAWSNARLVSEIRDRLIGMIG